jgi:hypothetical protein
MPLTVVLDSTRGKAVTESANGIGMRADVATNGFGVPVTIVSALGLPVIFYGPDGSLWPGGVAPGGSTLQSDVGVDMLADVGSPILVQ